MSFKKMGCKATNLNVRPRFLLSHIKRNTPLLKEVWNIFEHNMFELKQGNFKDILKTMYIVMLLKCKNISKSSEEKGCIQS